MRIGFIGGGNVGGNLANLLQRAGHEVIVGLRDPAHARPDAAYRVASVDEAASQGEPVLVALPFAAIEVALPPLSEALAGKVVVDLSNPVNEDWSPKLLGEENSAGETVARLLPRSRVVKAFNTIFADVMTPERLDRGGRTISAFIAGDDAAASDMVEELARSAGFAPVITGPLRNARYLEALAHLNIAIASSGGTNAAFLYDQAGA